MDQCTQDCANSEACVEILGKSARTRRFLLTFLLTTSYHLSSRPISVANESFFKRLALYSDDALARLRTGGWELLSPTLEEGISTLEPLSEWTKGRSSQREMMRRFRLAFRQYFRELNVPWSAFPPLDQFTLDDWPQADHILVAFGPNIGIGDEMIFFRLVECLARRYPGAFLEIYTFHPTIWELCSNVSEIRCGQSPLGAYALAKLLLQRKRNALIAFVEFASAPIYRQLEQVAGLNRFLCFDTGARVVRMVDQEKPAILDYRSRRADTVYTVLDDLLDQIGVSRIKKAVPHTPAAETLQTRRRVFLNTFSSKDTSEITPQWWAGILNTAAAANPLHVEIFAGTNEETRSYAAAIQSSLDCQTCTSSLYGNEQTPDLGDTLQKAISCDAVLGIDTFTGHLNNIKSIASVTVFLDSKWLAWRVPDPAVLNVSIHDDCETIGELLARLLQKPDAEFINLTRELNRETDGIRRMLLSPDVTGLLPALRRCMVLADHLGEIDPGLKTTFTDLPATFVNPLLQVLSTVTFPTERLRELLEDAWQHWETSNFSRYLRYIASDE